MLAKAYGYSNTRPKNSHPMGYLGKQLASPALEQSVTLLTIRIHRLGIITSGVVCKLA
jgi:hypothetical protein